MDFLHALDDHDDVHRFTRDVSDGGHHFTMKNHVPDSVKADLPQNSWGKIRA